MSEAIARLNAALEGRYSIERELGEGGMATVYLADDLKHERKVALKVLKPELAAVVGAERFLSEIKVTANLNHPHILPLHDSGEADSFLFYVMPYLEGESLRDRIDREKQLPVDEAVRIATAVANALDHAHRHKVIHRDIKPANILLQDGEPVVADFGIALAVGAGGGNRLTETGLSLGTPYYMSPEQATGDQPVGASTDTYALGSVLYEMLVGDPPYPGSTAQAVLGKIIAGKPVSATEQRPSIPAHVDAAVQKALEKLPADRFTSAKAFAEALVDPGFRHGELVGTGATAGTGLWKRLGIGFAVTAAAFATALGWALLLLQRPGPGVLHSSLGLSDEQAPVPSFGNSIALSSDGHRLVYVGSREDGTGLWLKERDELRPKFLAGTEGALQPTFSPDGDRIAFFAEGRRGPRELKVVSITGGPPITLADSGLNRAGLSWAPDGHIYSTGRPDPLLARISEAGGAVEALSTHDEGEAYHLLPHALPNGRGVLFTVRRGMGLPRVGGRARPGERGAPRDRSGARRSLFGIGSHSRDPTRRHRRRLRVRPGRPDRYRSTGKHS